MTRRILGRSNFFRGGRRLFAGGFAKAAFSVWCFDGGIVVVCGEFVVC